MKLLKITDESFKSAIKEFIPIFKKGPFPILLFLMLSVIFNYFGVHLEQEGVELSLSQTALLLAGGIVSLVAYLMLVTHLVCHVYGKSTKTLGFWGLTWGKEEVKVIFTFLLIILSFSTPFALLFFIFGEGLISFLMQSGWLFILIGIASLILGVIGFLYLLMRTYFFGIFIYAGVPKPVRSSWKLFKIGIKTQLKFLFFFIFLSWVPMAFVLGLDKLKNFHLSDEILALAYTFGDFILLLHISFMVFFSLSVLKELASTEAYDNIIGNIKALAAKRGGV